jgi:hypothetical protein
MTCIDEVVAYVNSSHNILQKAMSEVALSLSEEGVIPGIKPVKYEAGKLHKEPRSSAFHFIKIQVLCFVWFSY